MIKYEFLIVMLFYNSNIIWLVYDESQVVDCFSRVKKRVSIYLGSLAVNVFSLSLLHKKIEI
ncbi:hypothetical protein DWW52_14640 [Odoribacter sp. AF15-53]|nr:hypothetical protein DWW52_14640 [Odoribacter sp. AF15-53]